MKQFSKYTSATKTSWHTRLFFIRGVICLFATVLIIRLFMLQIVGYADYKAAADGEHTFYKKLFPKRGEMFIRGYKRDGALDPFLVERNGEKVFPAVTNHEFTLIYADPRHIEDSIKAAEIIAPLLELDVEVLKEKFQKKGDAYEVVKNKVADELAQKVRDLSIKGIYFAPQERRYYPEPGLGGHMFGYVSASGDTQRGRYGLEGYFDEILRGKEGSLKLETDAIGTLIPVGDKRVTEAVDGSDLILTIDRTVQLVACDKLKKWVIQHGADGGSIIIQDPQTGAIRALCATPDFDPAQYGKSDIGTFNNPAIFSPYEPGSVFKAFTMAIGLELEKVTPTMTYIDTGSVKIGSYTIKNSDGKAHGLQTMMGVLDESLNTGTIFVARRVGIEQFRKYLKSFGFGSKTGIDLDTETSGTISSLDQKNSDIYVATASFGQGITVTPMQLVTAYGALANGGKLMKPYIVDQVIKSDGTIIKTKPNMVRQVISARTSDLIGGMLVNVVRKGHGKRAGVPGYFVAGKTGTAQVPRKDKKGYEQNATIGSFAGYAPVEQPAFVMLVRIDNPRDVQWAESSAAPLFGEMARFLLQYYEVPPDEKYPKNPS